MEQTAEPTAELVAQGSLGGDSPWPYRRPVKEDRHMPPDAPLSTRSGVSSPGPGPESPAPEPGPLHPVGAARLLAAFTAEQSDPTRFYTLLARDSIALVERHTRLAGARVADIGGGAGFFNRLFRARGAQCLLGGPDPGELFRQG